MSKFKTSIPVDLAAIKDALPARSFISDVRFDGERVIVEWENDNFKTPFTYAFEWQDLAKIPAGVQDAVTNPVPKAAAPAKSAAPKMYAPVSGQQTSSASPIKGKPDDAPGVKKKPAAK